MEMTVLERLMIQNLLPKEANFLTLKLMRTFREDLSFDEEELKKLNLRQDGEQVKWNEGIDLVKDVKVGETMQNILVEIMKKLDEDKKLTFEHFSLYEKFMEIPKEGETKH